MGNVLKLQFRVYGEGTPILLVPGGLTGSKSWDPFIEIFTGQHKKVILVQLLNVEYGIDNRPLPANYSVNTESQALNEAISSLGHSKPIDIVGWSYGGVTALDYSLNHPDKVRTLTLIEPPAIWILRALDEVDKETKNTLDFFKKLHDDITEDMLEEFVNRAGLVKPGQSARKLPQWNDWIHFRQSLKNNPALIAQTDSLSRLKKLQVPVLLIKGTGSAPFLHKIIDGISANLPNACVIELPGGHAPHIVSKDSFLLQLEKFQMESIDEMEKIF